LALSDKTVMLVNGAVEKFGNTRELFAQQQAPQAPAAQPAAAKAVEGDTPVVQISTSAQKG
jgi:ABC-type protease/lipase transport system fused ATPase/permease subunit